MADDIANARPIASAEYTDSNRYETVCALGHRGVVALQQQKFEVLFEIGAYAINDGYYREAVSSFTSSLERFYEFFIRASFRQNGIDAAVFAEAWKNLSNHSERQLGAYVMTYTSALGRSPALLPQKRVEFRNAVVHKGRIPTRAEALDYGGAVLDLLRSAILDAQGAFPEGVQRTIADHIISAATSGPGNLPVATTSIATIVSLSMGEPAHHQRTLESALNGLRVHQALMAGLPGG